MFNNKLDKIFPYLYNQFEPNDIILIESDISSWTKILENFKGNIHYVYINIHNKYAINNVPKNWNIYNTLLWNEKKEIKYYELSNSLLNGTISSDILKNIWKNIKNINTQEILSENIKDFFLKNTDISLSKFLIIDSLDGLNKIKDFDLISSNIKVLAARVINEDLENISKEKFDNYVTSVNFKEIAFFEDSYPNMGIVIYIKDSEKVVSDKDIELKNKLSKIIHDLESIEKVLEVKEKENKNLKNELQTNKKDLKQLKQIKNKELEIVKNKLEWNRNENNKLRIHLEEEKKIIDNRIKLLETENNYYIKPNYISRTEYTHYNDQSCEDEWQLEVYLHALGLMKKNNYQTVLDIGCGSGYKLMHYLNEYKTVGLELAENLDFLKEKYPNRSWLKSNFDEIYKKETDIVICSDVIEHLVDPNQLLIFIERISFEYLVLSTPDRDFVYEKGSKFLDGPPRNQAHIREWNFNEFAKYIGQYFEIIDHRITNAGQSTQTMICKKKDKFNEFN